MLDTEKTSLLDQPLDMTQIKHRQGGGGRQLAYISGKFAMDQANRIFGYGQWGYKVVSRGQLVVDGSDGSKLTMYTADVELWVAGADFAFPGAGVGIVTRPYTVDMHEKAYKEAETDAMKRALRHYGDQFGLCLYDGEDYVDAGNGELVQVKNVPIQQNKPQQQQAPRRPSAPVGANASTTVRSNSNGATKQPDAASPTLILAARNLYAQLGRQAPADLEQKSALVVRRLMEQMNGEHREQLNAKNGHGSQGSGSQPTSTENAPDVASLRKRATALRLNWDAIVTSALKVNKPDDNIVVEERARIKEKLDIIEEQRARKPAEQKAS